MGILKAIWAFVRKYPLGAVLLMAGGFIAVMLIGGKTRSTLINWTEKIKPGAGDTTNPSA